MKKDIGDAIAEITESGHELEAIKLLLNSRIEKDKAAGEMRNYKQWEAVLMGGLFDVTRESGEQSPLSDKALAGLLKMNYGTMRTRIKLFKLHTTKDNNDGETNQTQ